MPINPADISTIRVGELPVDGITLDSKIAIENGSDLYQTTIQDLVDLLNINVGTLQYEEKTLHVTQEYIDDNFDVTGLGINLCTGFAICNGQNGTPPCDGLVSIGYGTNYSVIGGFGGSKDAVVVAHSHVVKVNENAAGSGFPAFEAATVQGTTFMTESAGVSGVNRNMQPYIIALKIMKL